MSYENLAGTRSEDVGLPTVPVVAFAHAGSMDYRSYGYDPKSPNSRQNVLYDRGTAWTPQRREQGISSLSEARETLKGRVLPPRVRGLLASRQVPRIFSLTGVIPDFNPDGSVQSPSYHAKAGIAGQSAQIPIIGRPTLVHMDGWSFLSMGRSYDRRDPKETDYGLRGGIGFGAPGEMTYGNVLSLAQEVYPGMYSVIENGADHPGKLDVSVVTIPRPSIEDAGFYGTIPLSTLDLS